MKPSLTRVTYAALAVCLGSVPTACGPRIYEFRVVPTLLCGRDTAVATWRVRGAPVLLISHGDARPQGSAASTKPDTLQLTLVATSGGKESLPRRQEVLRFASGQRGEFAAGNLRREATQAVWVDTVDAARWDSTRFRLATVTSSADRPMELRHAGRTVVLPPRGSSSALAGAPAGGEWEFRSPLTAAELQGGPVEPEYAPVSATLLCSPRPTP